MKSGQIPADLKITDDDAMTSNPEDDKMAVDGQAEAEDGPDNAEPEQKDNDPAVMEQVLSSNITSLKMLVFSWDYTNKFVLQKIRESENQGDKLMDIGEPSDLVMEFIINMSIFENHTKINMSSCNDSLV